MIWFFMQWQEFQVGFPNMSAICINIENAYISFFKFENKSTLISTLIH